MRRIRAAARLAGLAVVLLVCSAHIGSPDAWYEGPAGPYRVLVHVEAPRVVPGIAVVNVRPEGAEADRVTAFVNKFDATGGAPPPDEAKPVADLPGWYRTSLWVMSAGSNSVTVTVHGRRGTGSVVVPLVAVAGRRLEFNAPLATILGAAGLVLALGIFTIVGAAVRESVLPPGVEADAARRRRARLAIARAVVVFALAMTGTAAWWRAEDSAFVSRLYRPLAVSARVDTTSGVPELAFSIEDSTWVRQRNAGRPRPRGAGEAGELIEDHGQVMHLFVVADDARSAFAHLHPRTSDTITFRAPLPPLPDGRYRVFADIVQASGFTQTLNTELAVGGLREGQWKPGADDSWSVTSPSDSGTTLLDDSSSMKWLRGDTVLRAGDPVSLRFAVTGARGAAAGLEPYLGMAGHAVVVRRDGGVFIHLHPLGTISVAAQSRLTSGAASDTIGHALHAVTAVSDTVSFPYAFPDSGGYTIWVQVKRGGRILTGSFSAEVQGQQR